MQERRTRGRRCGSERGQFRAHDRAATGRARHREPTPEGLHPVREAAQARAGSEIGPADAVVGDLDDDGGVGRVTRTVTPEACAYLVTFASASDATK